MPTLARHIGLFALIVYGVGDMVGAGIYGTIGVAAGVMGNATWLAFVISMIVAMLTGLSYASLSSRYPKAGGASYVTQRAYGIPFLSYIVGLSVTASGLVSMAAGTNVFAQTLHASVPALPHSLIIFGFLLILGVINLIGIKESIIVNLICTAVEVLGLLFIVAIGMRYWGTVDYFEMPKETTLTLPLLLSGAVLTFYAFIGFEDMLNVAEEVKDPERTMPKGIIIAITIATLLYVAISITAVSVVPAASLANPALGAPMSQITSVAAPWVPSWVYNFITLFAVANTVLLNYIMGSRILYGMARDGLLPQKLSLVHPKSRTPHNTIVLIGVTVIGLAFVGSIAQLASATSLLLLLCFCIVNAALVVLKNRKDEPKGRMEIPTVIPVLGVISCGVLVFARITEPGADMTAPLIAGTIVATLSLLYFTLRKQQLN